MKILKSTKILIFKLKKKTLVNFGTSFITQSERYFKSPHRFDPDRWEKDEDGSEPIDPYSILSFGFGARMCIGRRAAEQEMFLTIAKVNSHFNFC